MSQLAFDATGPEPNPERAQWLTPPHIATAMCALADYVLSASASTGYPIHVLEPSAGRGNLVRAVREVCPRAWIDAVEIDARWRDDLFANGASRVVVADFLKWKPDLAQRYDLAITNPPFDGGEEGAHLAKLLDISERIVALLPSRSKHGLDRHEEVWERFDPMFGEPEWFIRHETHCRARPKFGPKGGTDEIDLVLLSREPGPCTKGWL